MKYPYLEPAMTNQVTNNEPWPVRDYRFKTYPGLPPKGEPGFYLGFDAEHKPWVLQWMPETAGGCWAALGYTYSKYHYGDMPEHRLCTDNHKDFIKEWAHSPVCDLIAPKLEQENLTYAYTASMLKNNWSKHWGPPNDTRRRDRTNPSPKAGDRHAQGAGADARRVAPHHR